jgi:signal transduction histidine kinase/CheY-like chemotaxis protein
VWHWTKQEARREVELDTQPIVWRGQPCGLTTAIDLTERHAADRERAALVEELRQSQKMEAIGRLAGGVAHDFNNILTAIIGYASLAADRARHDPELAASIQEIQLGAERASGLTAQLLAFSRKQVLQPCVLDLNAVVASMEGLLHRVLGEHILIATELGPELWSIKADPTQLGQVVLNLAVNARDAMPQGGTLRILTRNVDPGTAPPEAGTGPLVELMVHDTGLGMSEEVRARIFEPFFTTKGSHGTGLGLATAYGIVTQSGGAIVCDSRPGEGATFRVFFPRTAETAAPRPQSGDHVRSGHGRGRILLVEDDPRVRGLAEQVLRREGYQVDAVLPDEALEAHGRGTPPDLLLSDVVMPVMSGPEVARLLRGRQPGLRVLFVSGYADHFAAELTGSAVRDPVLTKPFTPGQLLRAVRAALSA